MRECSPKARESIGEIGRTNCEGITADFGLVPDGFAELVEKEERAAAVWRCGGFLLQTANNAQPARYPAACPWPQRCRTRRGFRRRASRRLDRTGRARLNQVHAGSYFRRMSKQNCDSQGVVLSEVDHGGTQSTRLSGPERSGDAVRERRLDRGARVGLSDLMWNTRGPAGRGPGGAFRAMRTLQSISIALIFLAGLAWAFGKWVLGGIAAVLALEHLQSASLAAWLDRLAQFQDIAERWISAHPNLGWILIIFACPFLLAKYPWPAVVRRWKVPALEIAYDNSDPRFVRRKIEI